MKERLLNRRLVLRSIMTATGAILLQFSVAHTVVRPYDEPFRNHPIWQPHQELITGHVTNEAGEPLAGVSVWLKGTDHRSSTNIDGEFQIPTNGSSAVLVFSYVGYENKEVSIGQQRTVSVQLSITETAINEVVVVGYGTQSKRKLSTAVSKVTGSSINHLPVSSPGNALAGMAAGVQVQSGGGDSPGEQPTIRIRGVGSLGGGNSPLYVVDGYPLQDASHFSRISPSDIESIEVLKDAASASIYGSRAANGVVIVTTKRGKSGKTSFNVNAYSGIQEVYRKMEMMNAEEYLQYAKDARNASGLGYPDVFDTPDQLANTDWQDVIFQRAPMSEVRLQALGGNEKIQFAISGSYLAQEGTLKGTDYKLASMRTNLDAALSDRLKIGVNLAPSVTIRNLQPVPGVSGPASYVPVYAALLMPPVVSTHLPNGDYGQNNVMPFTQYGFAETGIHNPLAVLELNQNRQNTLNLFNNAYLSWQPIDGLEIKTQGGATISSRTNETYIPSTLAYSTSPFANLSTPSLAGIQSQANSGRNIDWVWENTATYSRNFNDAHNLSGLLLFSMQKSDNQFVASTGRIGSFSNDIITNPTAATEQIGSLSYGRSSFLSYAARVNYDYKDKYMLMASIRTDASSRFGPQNRFGVFQSYSAAWRISEESFMASQHFFNELKLRASYGETGNANIGDNTWMSSVTARNYSYADVRVPGSILQGFQNENLTWEKNKQVNLGLDAAFLNNRIYLTMDAYRKNTVGMLFSKELPAIVGYATSFNTNIGRLQNEGFEIDLQTVNMQGIFSWSTNLNLSFNRTKVLDLGGRESLNTSAGVSGWPNVYKIEVGQPLGNMYGFIIDGVIRNDVQLNGNPQWPGSTVGSFQIRDVDGNGIINEGDRTLLGNGLPDFIYGVTNTITYRNFDLSMTIQGVLGSDVINGASRHTELWAGRFNAVKDLANNYFDPSNPDRDVKYGRVGSRSGFSTAGQLHTYAVYNGSFLRVRNITLGYNLSERIAQKLRFSSARIYVAGQNLFTLSDYPGFNPEPSMHGDSVYQPGVDQGTYPSNRTYLLGINFGF